MKRLALIALGSMTTLAACGSAGIAPDGSGSGVIRAVKTEYATSLGTAGQPARHVGCDQITNPTTNTTSTATQVVVEFEAAGEIQSIRVELKGGTDSQYDSFFVQDIPAGQLKTRPDGSYLAIFNANSATGRFLPSSIVVEPKPEERNTKLVTTTGAAVGNFYADLTIRTKTSSFPLTSKNVARIPVYRQCTLASTAQPLSQ
ncbi:hypothetical protein [Deinococcus multiflagellatus]|uniref:Lipoprotein n=1 Tax=Deinococcus multiflagellatus TaxID=1656887 RepID=A0ABW1ZHB1_9DEIO|nr:hypothetical protein [Deinococcus multiflagellatus]MBZ9712115.1 hypothetical protein [Deinococcus multiflagellatus]